MAAAAPTLALTIRGGQRAHALSVGVKPHESRKARLLCSSRRYWIHVGEAVEPLPPELSSLLGEDCTEHALPHSAIIGAFEVSLEETPLRKEIAYTPFDDLKEGYEFVNITTRAWRFRAEDVIRGVGGQQRLGWELQPAHQARAAAAFQRAIEHTPQPVRLHTELYNQRVSRGGGRSGGGRSSGGRGRGGGRGRTAGGATSADAGSTSADAGSGSAHAAQQPTPPSQCSWRLDADVPPWVELAGAQGATLYVDLNEPYDVHGDPRTSDYVVRVAVQDDRAGQRGLISVGNEEDTVSMDWAKLLMHVYSSSIAGPHSATIGVCLYRPGEHLTQIRKGILPRLFGEERGEQLEKRAVELNKLYSKLCARGELAHACAPHSTGVRLILRLTAR